MQTPVRRSSRIADASGRRSLVGQGLETVIKRRRSPSRGRSPASRSPSPVKAERQSSTKSSKSSNNLLTSLSNVFDGAVLYMCFLYMGLLCYIIATGWKVPDTAPKAETNYGEACEFSKDNVLSRVDVFIASHFMGWFVQIFMWRNFQLVFLLSVQFEMVELSFCHWLPNFTECWWDSVFLDTLGFNLLGSLMGIALFKYLGMRQIDWLGVGGANSNKKKNDEWLKRGVICFLLMVCNNLGQATGFFLKTTFHIPETSSLFKIHMASFGILGVRAIAATEHYLFPASKTKKPDKWGAFIAACFVSILLLETAIIIKHGEKVMIKDTPTWVPFFWALQFLSVLLVVKFRSYTGTTALILGTMAISACGAYFNTLKTP